MSWNCSPLDSISEQSEARRVPSLRTKCNDFERRKTQYQQIARVLDRAGVGQEETFDLAFQSGHMGSRARIAGMGPHAVVRWAANGHSNTNKRLERNCHGRALLNSNSVYREGTTTVLRQKDCALKCSRGRRGSL